LDGTAAGDQVLPYVKLLAKRLGQPVTLLAVILGDDDLDPINSPANIATASLRVEQRRFAQRYLDTVAEGLAQDGIVATTEVVTGPVAERIVAFADVLQSGLIAMGTHGRVGPERWFLGSVADKVVRLATVPVLLIRPRDAGPAVPASIAQIVLPLDGSPLAEVALPYARYLAKAFSAPLILVRTEPITGWGMTYTEPYGGAVFAPELLTSMEGEAQRYLEQTAAPLRSDGIETRTRYVVFRSPEGEIADLVGTTPGTLVVMSTHGRSGLRRTLLGSVTDRVIRSSAAPVLVVRESPREERQESG
jgi:nucleotide-binding universal stress UspA family protein